MKKQTFDILALNETRLDNSILDSSLHLSGYNLIRRGKNRGGGSVCSYIRNSINYTRRFDLENESWESVALEIRKPNTKPFVVFCWYRPPHSPVEHFEILESLFKQAEIDDSDIYISIFTYQLQPSTRLKGFADNALH